MNIRISNDDLKEYSGVTKMGNEQTDNDESEYETSIET